MDKLLTMMFVLPHGNSFRCGCRALCASVHVLKVCEARRKLGGDELFVRVVEHRFFVLIVAT
jgi:hypothetical protein